MKRRHFIGVVAAAGLLGIGALVVGQSKVSPQAIASSVTRTPERMLISREKNRIPIRRANVD